jgi:hypothetical protein
MTNLLNLNLSEFFIKIINKELTISDVIEYLNENKFYEKQRDDESYSEIGEEYDSEVYDLEKQCFKIVDVKGGGEGGGEYYHEVLHILPLDTYIMHEGSYFSYNGVDYLQKYYQCAPVEVTTIVYKGV